MVSPPKGPVRRTARLLQLGFGLAGSYLGYQLQRQFLDEDRAEGKGRDFRRKGARRVREKLQELRGPVMKIGQALSMQTRLLGPELVEELSALQMHAPAMHPTLMRAQFRSDFGKYPEEVFKSFEPEPFAAASLGQVHRAVTKKGEAVAVKIQYPAMREAIESDFQALRAAAFTARLTGHLDDQVISEVQRGILEETDYAKEARNIEFFGKALAPLPFVRVPKVHHDLSSLRVLTMSRLAGSRASDFLASNPSQELRDQIGNALTHLFFFQLFRVQALHADPHPGNYLFNPDGSIGLVDFGCVKYLKPEVPRTYLKMWRRNWADDPKLFAEIIRVLFGPKVSPAAPRIRRCMGEIKRFYDEFHPFDQPGHLLDLSDTKYIDALGRLAQVILKSKFISPEFVFLSRTESGMCMLLHMLKARVATTDIVCQWMPPE